MPDIAPWLLVGLGNPGGKYAHHRHNVGFMVADAWLSSESPHSSWREKWQSLVSSARNGYGRCVVLKPQTFMNRCGKAVVAAAGFHQVPAPRIIVVHDELDFEFGRVAIKNGGGHGGHNGLRDIVELLGARDFMRVRVGIGRPRHGDVSNWVLSDFPSEDAAELPDLVDKARRAATAIMVEGVRAAMNAFNESPSPPVPDEPPEPPREPSDPE